MPGTGSESSLSVSLMMRRESAMSAGCVQVRVIVSRVSLAESG